jgi:hypothetical protein
MDIQRHTGDWYNMKGAKHLPEISVKNKVQEMSQMLKVIQLSLSLHSLV